MKTFKDLEFNPKVGGGTQAKLDFDNGYGVSVITGFGAYSNTTEPYELAIIHDGDLCYNTHITNDVLGYQTEEDITKILKQVQNLK